MRNSLADLAERIKETHGEFVAAQRMTVEKAVEIGRLLCDAKELCQHGEWLPLLARSGVGERWARRLIQIFRSGLEPAFMSDLGGIAGTLAFLARRRQVVALLEQAARAGEIEQEEILSRACTGCNELVGMFGNGGAA